VEDQLRKSAGLWRGVAAVTMVLGIIGVVVIAIGVSKVEGYYGEETDVGVLVGVLLGGLLGLMLSLGFFFMGARIMEGLADLIGITRFQAHQTAAAIDGSVSSTSGVVEPPASMVYRHVAEPGAALRTQPTGGEVVATLTPGTRVRELGQEGRFVKVTAPKGVTGWVRKDQLL
jgi:hypothetical protein